MAETKKRKPRKTYTEEEKQQFMNDLHTVGRKGVKLPRINVAFTPANHEYLTIMSRVHGQNLTEFTNAIIEKHRADHMDTYNKAKEFIASL